MLGSVNRLPADIGVFVGRQRERARVETLLGTGARVVTLVGPGGMGKTRLAVRCAAAWLHDPQVGAVCFVELADARTETEVAIAIARALDVPLASGGASKKLASAVAAHPPCCSCSTTWNR